MVIFFCFEALMREDVLRVGTGGSDGGGVFDGLSTAGAAMLGAGVSGSAFGSIVSGWTIFKSSGFVVSAVS